MLRIVCILIGYAIGCVQTAYLVGKARGVDIRKEGSGNLGFTNTLRVLGKKAGLTVFFIDMGKAIGAFFLCKALFGGSIVLAFYGGAGVVLGHDFPFYLHFKGGKGILASIGTVVAIGMAGYWPATLIAGAIGIPPVATGYVSVGSLCFCASFPFALLASGAPTEVVWVGAGLSALAVWKHRENIRRLCNGTENNFHKNKKKKKEDQSK